MNNTIVNLLFTIVLTSTGLAQPHDNRPNVILIYVDDLGYGDLSCYGATRIATPAIDALANQGIRFTNGHATSSTCTPSRYAMMTGQYAWRKQGTGILEGDAPLIIPVAANTLPKVFKREGYTTAVVGKWHLGLGDSINKNWNASIKPGPNEIGFDYSFIFPATADRVPTVFMENDKVVGLEKDDPLYIDYKNKIGNEPTGKENPELLKLTATGTQHSNTIVNGISRIGFMTGGKLARWTDEELGLVFLEKAKQFVQQRKSQPFFLYYSMHSIHTPRMPSTMFKGKSVLGYRGDAMLEMDWAVGELTKQLKQLGIDKNTMIIFTSDNGPVLHDAYNDEAVEKNGDHKPAGLFKGGKYTVWEGGTRVPFIISWPDKINAAATSDALVTQIDFMASFAGFFGQSSSADDMHDSKDLWTDLIGKTKKGRENMVEQGMSELALLLGEWKYIPATAKLAARLYHLKNDVHEDNDLSSRFPEKVKEMADLFQAIIR